MSKIFGKGILSEGYGIIPNKVLFSKNINTFDKLLFCLISSLTAKKGYCMATNKYLSEKLNRGSTTVSLSIKRLKKLNIIFIEVKNYRRCIFLNNFFKNNL